MSESLSNQKPRSFMNREHYTMQDLLEIMAYLRSPQGCPWDREQSHATLRTNMLEEAYEAIEAIDSGRPERLCDELGDVLMQVVFHAQIAAENRQFDFSDVLSAICNKLISRHSHIFAGDQAATADEVIETWERNKRREKGHQNQAEVLGDVARSLPALHRSYKIQQKAAQVGFDWQDPQGPRQKITEELQEIEDCLSRVKQASAEPTAMTADGLSDFDRQQLADEVGDLLFAVVNYARHLKVQPEIALNRTSDRFVRRFAAVEQLALARGLQLEGMSLPELDQLWEAVKSQEGHHHET